MSSRTSWTAAIPGLIGQNGFPWISRVTVFRPGASLSCVAGIARAAPRVREARRQRARGRASAPGQLLNETRGVRLNPVTAYAKVEHAADEGKHVIRHDRRAALSDRLNERADIPACQPPNGSGLPRWQECSFAEQPRRACARYLGVRICFDDRRDAGCASAK